MSVAASCAEPPHVHVERAGCRAKVWLEPVRVADPGDFRSPEIARIVREVRTHHDRLRRGWDEFFAH